MDRNLVMIFLEQLRKRLIIMAITVTVASILCFYFVEPIRQVLLLPGRGLQIEMIFLTPSEVFMSNLRLAVVTGLVVSLPVILYQVTALIGAVNRHFKKKAFFLAGAMFVLFVLGLSFSYFVVFPFALKFFLSFSRADLIPKFSINQYITFTVSFLAVFGLVFQLPLAFWFLGVAGLVSSSFLRRNRKYALLVILIISAVLTPPDVFSQIMMAIPLTLLYELGIVMVYFARRDQKVRKRALDQKAPG
ncbi:MAG TPA: twin-arginine translocase subunit TatC [Firmicutes bacterium]|nr:twin-arginine translocase subunit TatC [Bacillota bacterium]